MGLADNMPKDAIGDLKRQVRDLERAIRELRAERRLEAATIGAGGLTVKGGKISVVDPVTGDVLALLDAAGLTVDGNAAFGGNVAITGTLSLPAGIIDNEALANPIVPQSVWKGTTSNFGLAVAWSTLVTQVLTVPSGVNAVQVVGFVRLVAANSTASKDYLYSDFDIGGQSCGGFSTPVESGEYGTSFCAFARTMTGLTPGGTVALTASGSTGSASWASGPNVCQIAASVTWYR